MAFENINSQITELIDSSREIVRLRTQTKNLMQRKIILTNEISQYMKNHNKTTIEQQDVIIKHKTISKTESIPKARLAILLAQEGISVEIDEKIKFIKKSQTKNKEIIGISFKK